MNPIIIGNGTALPSLGSRVDSVADSHSRRPPRVAEAAFPTDGQASRPAPVSAPQNRPAAALSGDFPFLRRRTDRGEPADASIQIPPHLERRQAWREAFGLNTYHTQELAQRGDPLPSRQLRSAATHAYRSPAARGSLDLDLAQLVSMTV